MAEETTISREQIAFLARQTTINTAATIGVALFTSAVLWRSVPHLWLVIWFSVHGLLSSTLYFRQRKFDVTQISDGNSKRALRHARLWALVSGFTWGALAFFMPLLEPAEQLAVVIVVTSMSSSSTTTLGAVPHVAAAFILSAIIPFVIFFLLKGGLTFVALAAMASILALALLAATRIVYGVFLEAIYNRQENAALLEQIRRERQESAKDLSQSEERYSDLVENVGDLIQSIDADGKYVFVNQAWKNALGYSENEALSMNFLDVVREDYRPHCMELFQRLGQGENFDTVEVVFNTRDGKPLWLEGTISALRENGKLVRTRGIFRDVGVRKQAERQQQHAREVLEEAVTQATADLAATNASLEQEITERRQAEASARESQAQLRLILDSTEEGIYGVDRDGMCIFANASCAAILGYDSAAQLIGLDMHEIVHGPLLSTGDPSSQNCPVCHTHRSGQQARTQEQDRFGRRDGSTFPVQYLANPIMRLGKVDGAVVAFFDASNRRAMEEQLRQSQKMEAVGQLTGGIAHDFNNLLAVMSGNLELALSNLQQETPLPVDKVQSRVAAAARAAERGAELVQRLLAFSRKTPVQSRVLDIAEPVRQIADLLERTLGTSVDFQLRVGTDLWPVRLDPAQLENALLNLGINARDAMPDGGELNIEVSKSELTAPIIGNRLWVPPGRYVCLAIHDTGTGMPPETVEKVFEPFFTTKSADKGTGLGMSMVYGFVEQSGGYIGIESEPGAGTTVSIYLPAASEQELEMTGTASMNQPI